MEKEETRRGVGEVGVPQGSNQGVAVAVPACG